MEKEPREKCSRQDNAVEKLFAEKVSDDKRQAQEEASLKNMSEAIQSAPHFTGPKSGKEEVQDFLRLCFPILGTPRPQPWFKQVYSSSQLQQHLHGFAFSGVQKAGMIGFLETFCMTLEESLGNHATRCRAGTSALNLRWSNS